MHLFSAFMLTYLNELKLFDLVGRETIIGMKLCCAKRQSNRIVDQKFCIINCIFNCIIAFSISKLLIFQAYLVGSVRLCHSPFC